MIPTCIKRTQILNVKVSHPENIEYLKRTRLSRRRMIQQVVSLSQSSCVLPAELADRRGGGGEGGAKSYNGENAWSSINRLILSAPTCRIRSHPPNAWGGGGM